MHPSRTRPAPIKKGARLVWAGLCLALLSLNTVAWAGSSTYTYDSLGRLTQVVYSNGQSTTTIKYSYDPAGNRTSVVTTTP